MVFLRLAAILTGAHPFCRDPWGSQPHCPHMLHPCVAAPSHSACIGTVPLQMVPDGMFFHTQSKSLRRWFIFGTSSVPRRGFVCARRRSEFCQSLLPAASLCSLRSRCLGSWDNTGNGAWITNLPMIFGSVNVFHGQFCSCNSLQDCNLSFQKWTTAVFVPVRKR